MEEKRHHFQYGEKFKKRVSLEQITDIIGFRIIVESIDDCYKTLGILHKQWNCIPGKFKDYISSPKINGYKSIHTSVIGSYKKPIEIQIRTREMHDFAERGMLLIGSINHLKRLTHLHGKNMIG